MLKLKTTSCKFPIVKWIYGLLVVGIKYKGFIAAGGAALHGGVEAAGPIELGGVAPRAGRRASAVAARRLTRARVLCQQLFRALSQTRNKQARPQTKQ